MASQLGGFGRTRSTKFNQAAQQPRNPCARGPERHFRFAALSPGIEPLAWLGIQRAGRAAKLRRFRSISADFGQVGKLSERRRRRSWLLKTHS